MTENKYSTIQITDTEILPMRSLHKSLKCWRIIVFFQPCLRETEWNSPWCWIYWGSLGCRCDSGASSSCLDQIHCHRTHFLDWQLRIQASVPATADNIILNNDHDELCLCMWVSVCRNTISNHNMMPNHNGTIVTRDQLGESQSSAAGWSGWVCLFWLSFTVSAQTVSTNKSYSPVWVWVALVYFCWWCPGPGGDDPLENPRCCEASDRCWGSILAWSLQVLHHRLAPAWCWGSLQSGIQSAETGGWGRGWWGRGCAPPGWWPGVAWSGSGDSPALTWAEGWDRVEWSWDWHWRYCEWFQWVRRRRRSWPGWSRSHSPGAAWCCWQCSLSKHQDHPQEWGQWSLLPWRYQQCWQYHRMHPDLLDSQSWWYQEGTRFHWTLHQRGRRCNRMILELTLLVDLMVWCRY